MEGDKQVDVLAPPSVDVGGDEPTAETIEAVVVDSVEAAACIPVDDAAVDPTSISTEAVVPVNGSTFEAAASPVAAFSESSPRKRKKKQLGGLTADKKCRRCVEGPRYKKGHHLSCPLSAYYKGPIAVPKRRSRPFPIRKPRSNQAEEAYKQLQRATQFQTSLNLEVTAAHQKVMEAQQYLEVVLAKREAAAKAVKEAQDGVVQAELEEPDEWNGMYQKLKAYGEQHGNILFPRGIADTSDDPDFQVLCKWVKHQRNKREKVKWQRKAALDKLGFVWDPFEAVWIDQYAALQAFKEAHGHCNVPSNYSEHPSLPVWIATQRRNYRLINEGKKTQLTPERIKELDDLGFEWSKYVKTRWQSQFDDLINYQKVHGNFEVPQDYPNLGLSPWVDQQRAQYKSYIKGKTSVLSAERIKKLDDVGFPWHDEALWQEQYQALAAYQREHGDCNVPKKHPTKLYPFVTKQRTDYATLHSGGITPMTEHRMTLLNRLQFQWEQPAEANQDDEEPAAKLVGEEVSDPMDVADHEPLVAEETGIPDDPVETVRIGEV